MDPALLRQREDFDRKALQMPAVTRKRRLKRENEGNSTSVPSEAKLLRNTETPGLSFSTTSYGSSGGYRSRSCSSSSYNLHFSVLSKILKHLMNKYQEREASPLSLEEILDETNQLDVSKKIRQFLIEALPVHHKIEPMPEGKFRFRPPLKCRSKLSLLQLLKFQAKNGLGGILLDDVVESVPSAELVLHDLQSQILTITRQDKKKVLFYNDTPKRIFVGEEIVRLWRSVSVNGLEDSKIDECLDKWGIRFLPGQSFHKIPQETKRGVKKDIKRKTVRKIKDNEHVLSDLKHYE